MSAESQSENIWRYAMRPPEVIEDMRSEPLHAVNDASGGHGAGMATMTDFTGDFGSIPSQFNFHGLVPTQSQSQITWSVSENAVSQAVGRTDSQKENMQFPISSGSRPPLLSAPPSNPDTRETIIGGPKVQSSHVTGHVTGASQARADATLPPVDSTNASTTFSSGFAHLIQERERAARSTPLKVNNKTVPLPSITAPPSSSPPTVSCIKSMPPHLNRYAPRNVDPSSQDSFAGPPVVQDLNEFARSSRILSNTFIRRSETGVVEAVFHRPSNFSSNSSPDPAADEVMSVSQSEQPEATTASQIIRAAFDPSLSPPPPEPVVLVKDSQSEHHDQDSDRGVDAQELSSSCGSFHLPSPDADMVPTQPNSPTSQNDMQPTRHNTQPTQLVLPPASLPHSANAGPSPLPVPPHRRRQFAALEAARLRMREEVVPETPQSIVPPHPMRNDGTPMESRGDARVQKKDNEIPKPRSSRARDHRKGKDMLDAEIPATTRPASMGNIPAQAGASPVGIIRSKIPEPAPQPRKGAPSKQLPINYEPRGSEVVPDSQEEQRRQADHRTGVMVRKHQPEGEIIPDSQEEPQANITVASSPAIPLKDLPHRNAREGSPTPTPAAVKSQLDRGQLPDGVTHTRGRLRDIKGKGKAKAVEGEDEVDKRDDNDVTPPVQKDAEEGMDVDKEQSPPEAPPARVYKRKRGPSRSMTKKKPTAPTVSKNSTRGKRSTTTTAAATSGPSTRSKKRKSDTPAESVEDDEGTPTSFAPIPKRQRKSKVLTEAPAGAFLTSTRVFARRADKGNYYFPGTVNISGGSAASSQAPPKVRVNFDDGLETEVGVQYMRRFELENFDNVHIKWPAKHKDCGAEVIGTEQWDDELVEVQELDCGPDGEDFEVSSKFISIPEARILQQFSERRISFRLLRGDSDFDVPFDVPPKNEHLSGMAFVITLPDLPRGKRSLEKLIIASGGVVFEEWNSIISLDGKVELYGRRMSGAADKVRMKKDIPDQLFCLADEARTTPKYLIALALGVPCLSLKWVLERTLKPDNEHRVDWPAYILPAGYNSTTRMPASQAFSRKWWQTSGNTPNLILDPPTIKPLLGKSFLCFGTKEFLFAQNELGIFPKLLLAMGASHVEAVTDIAHVDKLPVQFHYTVVDDGETLMEYQSALSVNSGWIKKCLIAGLEGPVPWPDPIQL